MKEQKINLLKVDGMHIFPIIDLDFIEIGNDGNWEVHTKDNFIYIIRGTKSQAFDIDEIIFA